MSQYITCKCIRYIFVTTTLQVPKIAGVGGLQLCLNGTQTIYIGQNRLPNESVYHQPTNQRNLTQDVTWRGQRERVHENDASMHAYRYKMYSRLLQPTS